MRTRLGRGCGRRVAARAASAARSTLVRAAVGWLLPDAFQEWGG